MNDRRIVFVNRFFHPDISATSQILGELTFELAQAGRAITVVTSRSAYNSPGVHFPVSEQVRGVEIVRIGKSHFKRTHYAGRMADLMVFYFLVFVKLLKLVDSSDILVCKTDPPMLIVIGAIIKTFKKCRLISWNQDLFPEVAQTYFDRNPLKLVYRSLTRVRDSSLKLCDQNIAISAAMESKLNSHGVDRVHIITNWGKPVVADAGKVLELKKSWQVENQFIVEYSGNFGFVHEYETIKNTIELLAGQPSIVFVFIGSGKHYETLQNHAQNKQLSNVKFKPYQPASKLSESLSLADLHLITFRPEMDGLVFPSKFYGICAAARPVLLIGDRQSELAEIINQADCGQCFNTGESRLIADYLLECSARPDLLYRQGRRAHQLFVQNYTLEQAVEKWNHVLDMPRVI